jgi:hypothetical protein
MLSLLFLCILTFTQGKESQLFSLGKNSIKNDMVMAI